MTSHSSDFSRAFAGVLEKRNDICLKFFICFLVLSAAVKKIYYKTIQKKEKKKREKEMAEEKQPLLLKTGSTQKISTTWTIFWKTTKPEPVPNFLPQIVTLFTTISSITQFANERGEKSLECFEKKDEQQTALEKLIFGEYETLREMAINHRPKKRVGLKDII